MDFPFASRNLDFSCYSPVAYSLNQTAYQHVFAILILRTFLDSFLAVCSSLPIHWLLDPASSHSSYKPQLLIPSIFTLSSIFSSDSKSQSLCPVTTTLPFSYSYLFEHPFSGKLVFNQFLSIQIYLLLLAYSLRLSTPPVQASTHPGFPSQSPSPLRPNFFYFCPSIFRFIEN